VALFVPAVVSAAPGNYKAQRFDVMARAVNGNLEVSESITFEFQSGTFTRVWREIPASRTDGIHILEVAMDGAALTQGDAPGHFTISGDNRVRVEWRFSETPASVHRFDLRYVARGVVYTQGGTDVIRWRALPAEHRYGIDSSLIQFEPAAARIAPLETRNVKSAVAHASNEATIIEASGIAPNGWVTADLRYTPGTLASVQPRWFLRQAAASALAPWWAMAGAAVFVAGVLVILVLRQRYTPPQSIAPETVTTVPPEPLPAALASVLAARGRTSGYPAMGTLLDLADRGLLIVRDVPGNFGGHRYELSQVPGTHDLAGHEAAALSIAFADRAEDVSVAKARGRLARGGRKLMAAIDADLTARGLIDPDRKAARDRLGAVSLAMVLLSALGCVAVAPLIPSYDGWPFLVPLGSALAGMAGLILASTTTPLSDAGLVEAARWRGFRRHLRTLASGAGERGDAPVPPRWIVYAIGAGLGRYWSRYLKRNPGVTPPWFIAAGEDPRAFAVFVGSHSGGGSAAGAGGGAAAGGGGSGAG
jgi:hypothetical protein